MTTPHPIGDLLHSGVKPTEEETACLREMGAFVGNLFARLVDGRKKVVGSGLELWSNSLSGRLSASTGSRWESGLGIGAGLLDDTWSSFWNLSKNGFAGGYDWADAERPFLTLEDEDTAATPAEEVVESPVVRKPRGRSGLFGRNPRNFARLQPPTMPAATSPRQEGEKASTDSAAAWRGGGVVDLAVARALSQGGLFVADQLVRSAVRRDGNGPIRGILASFGNESNGQSLSSNEKAFQGQAAASQPSRRADSGSSDFPAWGPEGVRLDGMWIDGRTPALAAALTRVGQVFGGGAAAERDALAISERRLSKLTSTQALSLDSRGEGQRPVYAFYDAAETTFLKLDDVDARQVPLDSVDAAQPERSRPAARRRSVSSPTTQGWRSGPAAVQGPARATAKSLVGASGSSELRPARTSAPVAGIQSSVTGASQPVESAQASMGARSIAAQKVVGASSTRPAVSLNSVVAPAKFGAYGGGEVGGGYVSSSNRAAVLPLSVWTRPSSRETRSIDVAPRVAYSPAGRPTPVEQRGQGFAPRLGTLQVALAPTSMQSRTASAEGGTQTAFDRVPEQGGGTSGGDAVGLTPASRLSREIGAPNLGDAGASRFSLPRAEWERVLAALSKPLQYGDESFGRAVSTAQSQVGTTTAGGIGVDASNRVLARRSEQPVAEGAARVPAGGMMQGLSLANPQFLGYGALPGGLGLGSKGAEFQAVGSERVGTGWQGLSEGMSFSQGWRLSADGGPDLPLGAALTRHEAFGSLMAARTANAAGLGTAPFSTLLSGGDTVRPSELAEMQDGMVWLSLAESGPSVDGFPAAMALSAVPSGRRAAMVPKSVVLKAMQGARPDFAMEGAPGRPQAGAFPAGVSSAEVLGAVQPVGFTQVSQTGQSRSASSESFVEARVRALTQGVLRPGAPESVEASVLSSFSGPSAAAGLSASLERPLIGSQVSGADVRGIGAAVSSQPTTIGTMAGEQAKPIGLSMAQASVERLLGTISYGLQSGGYGRLDEDRVLLAAGSTPVTEAATAELSEISPRLGRASTRGGFRRDVLRTVPGGAPRLAGGADVSRAGQHAGAGRDEGRIVEAGRLGGLRGQTSGDSREADGMRRQVGRQADAAGTGEARAMFTRLGFESGATEFASLERQVASQVGRSNAARVALSRAVATPTESRALAGLLGRDGAVVSELARIAGQGGPSDSSGAGGVVAKLLAGADSPWLSRDVLGKNLDRSWVNEIGQRWESSGEVLAAVHQLPSAARAKLGAKLAGYGWPEQDLRVLGLESVGNAEGLANLTATTESAASAGQARTARMFAVTTGMTGEKRAQGALEMAARAAAGSSDASRPERSASSFAGGVEPALGAVLGLQEMLVQKRQQSLGRVVAGAESVGGPVSQRLGGVGATVAARSMSVTPLPMLGREAEYFGGLAPSFKGVETGYRRFDDAVRELLRAAENAPVVEPGNASAVDAGATPEGRGGLIARLRRTAAELRTPGARSRQTVNDRRAETGGVDTGREMPLSRAPNGQATGLAAEVHRGGRIVEDERSGGEARRTLLPETQLANLAMNGEPLPFQVAGGQVAGRSTVAPGGTDKALGSALSESLLAAVEGRVQTLSRDGSLAREMAYSGDSLTMLSIEESPVSAGVQDRVAEALALSAAGPAGARRLFKSRGLSAQRADRSDVANGDRNQERVGLGERLGRRPDAKPSPSGSAGLEMPRTAAERFVERELASSSERTLGFSEEAGFALPIELKSVIAPEVMLHGLRSPEVAEALKQFSRRESIYGRDDSRVLTSLEDAGIELSASRESSTSTDLMSRSQTRAEGGTRSAEQRAFEQALTSLRHGAELSSVVRQLSSLARRPSLQVERALVSAMFDSDRSIAALGRRDKAGLLSAILRGTERVERTSLLEHAGIKDFAFSWLDRVDGSKAGLDIGLGDTRGEFRKALGPKTGLRESVLAGASPIGDASLVASAGTEDRSGLRAVGASLVQTATGAARSQHGASQAMRRTDWSFVDTGSRASTTHADLGKLAAAIVGSTQTSQRAPMPLVAPAVKAVAQTALLDSRNGSRAAPRPAAADQGGTEQRGAVDAKMNDRALEMLAVEMATRVSRLMGLMKERIGVWN